MLLNLTNHPSVNWSTEQKGAACCFGEIVDYAFPNVSPYMSEEEVSVLAKSIYDDVMGKYGSHGVTVHIMGEFSLTYRLISLLESSGIMCVASTTERIVSETEDGKKIVDFKFVRFRRYGNQ